MRLIVKTHDRLSLGADELTIPPSEINSLPWVRAGVAKLRESRLGYELEIGPYAGTLRMGSCVIEVHELLPGTVAACLELSQTGRRFGSQGSRPGRTIEPTAAVALAFVVALRETVGLGLRKEYVPVELGTQRPRGKLLVSPTLRGPWARGRTHEVIVRYRPLTEDNAINRLLLAAGVRAQYLLAERGVELLELRRCLIALSGAKLVAHPLQAITQTDLSEPTNSAISLGRSLLQGVPVVPEAGVGDIDHGFSAWINVERIFEEAILAVCERLRPGETEIGKNLDVPLFERLPDDPPPRQKRADPDIVIQSPRRTYVLDAKFRRSGDHPSDPDLYQLIAHAGAFSADAAALVTPALYGRPRSTWLGRTRSGCSIDVIAVDPRDAKGTELLLATWLDARGT